MRLAWADAARGAAMVLVVFAHSVQLMGAYGWTLGWLDTVNLYLTAVRMPLFFVVSGFLAERAIRRGWRELFASRLALLIYMYVLWGAIRAVWFTVAPWPLDDTPAWLAFAVSPIWPTNGLWFLYALVLYLVIGRLTARWRSWIVFALAGLVSLAAASDLVPTFGNGVWRSIALYALFFLLGARAPGLWRSLAERNGYLAAIAAAAAAGAAVVVFTLLPDSARGVGRVALSIVVVGAGIVLAATLSRSRSLAAPFVYVGKRTLAVYVVHTMVLGVIVPLVPVASAPAVVVVVVLTFVGTVVPLALRAATNEFDGIFSLPRAVTRRLASRSTA